MIREEIQDEGGSELEPPFSDFGFLWSRLELNQS
jgi:hypothetical protein